MRAGDRPAPEDPALVGHVVRPHALIGEVIVAPVDPATAHLEAGNEVWVAGRWRRVSRSRVHGARRIMGFDGVADREAAEALRGAELVIDAESLARLGGDRYYVHELVGCRLETPAGEDLGEVVAVVPGPQDCLEVEKLGRRSLVPMARAWLHSVDIEARRIVIDPPAGLAEATEG
jgi:16S rRNA processing protein RimM